MLKTLFMTCLLALSTVVYADKAGQDTTEDLTPVGLGRLSMNPPKSQKALLKFGKRMGNYTAKSSVFYFSLTTIKMVYAQNVLGICRTNLSKV
jgi:hypothetical protein